MWKCNRCEKELDDSINICPGCGAGRSTVETYVPDTTVQTEPEDQKIGRALIFGASNLPVPESVSQDNIGP
ncbi:MAG: hypothetical protein GY950_17715, partial [bacterium]|nr:hypothetical protein [bacterium]